MLLEDGDGNWGHRWVGRVVLGEGGEKQERILGVGLNPRQRSPEMETGRQ